LPRFQVPFISFSLETLFFIAPYAFILAAIGLIESLMTLNLIDELTETHGSGNRECVAQGAGNILNGFFGGMGGCAMIGQSIINIKSGGRGRLSGITAALALLFFILFGSSYIEQVPIAALVGVMFMVVLGTFAWSTFKVWNKVPNADMPIAALVGVMFMVVLGTFAWSTFKVWNKVPNADMIVIILVTVITVLFDLAIAVLAGVIVSSLVFAWENAKRIRARKHVDEHGVKHYEIYGPLFFGCIELFNSKFDVKNDPDEVVIDFKESRIVDQSAIECVNKLTERYHKNGKNIHLRHLSSDCVKLIKRAEKIYEVNVLEDPDYFVAIDNFRQAQNALAEK